MSTTTVTATAPSTTMAAPRMIDSKPPHPSPKEMKILILGMPRTGVSSLRAALNILGYTTFHGSMLQNTPELYPYWQEAISAYQYNTTTNYSREDYDKLLGDYDVSCNMPGTFVWKDLVDAYPDAKIILTNRDVDKWITSMEGSVDVGAKWKTWDIVTPFHPTQNAWWKYQKFQHKLRKFICPNGERQAYIDHYAAIREYVPKERILEYEIKDSWAPLCEFLGKKEPEQAFPHVNDREGFMVARTNRWWMAFNAMVSTLLPPFAVGVAGAMGYWISRF